MLFSTSIIIHIFIMKYYSVCGYFFTLEELNYALSLAKRFQAVASKSTLVCIEYEINDLKDDSNISLWESHLAESFQVLDAESHYQNYVEMKPLVTHSSLINYDGGMDGVRALTRMGRASTAASEILRAPFKFQNILQWDAWRVAGSSLGYWTYPHHEVKTPTFVYSKMATIGAEKPNSIIVVTRDAGHFLDDSQFHSVRPMRRLS